MSRQAAIFRAYWARVALKYFDNLAILHIQREAFIGLRQNGNIVQRVAANKQDIGECLLFNDTKLFGIGRTNLIGFSSRSRPHACWAIDRLIGLRPARLIWLLVSQRLKIIFASRS